MLIYEHVTELSHLRQYTWLKGVEPALWELLRSRREELRESSPVGYSLRAHIEAGVQVALTLGAHPLVESHIDPS